MSPRNLYTVEDEESVDGGSELSDMEDVFIGGEAELPKRSTIDVRSSKEEVELHNKTHLPYRSWCPHCVRGKARSRSHRKRRRKARGVECQLYQ